MNNCKSNNKQMKIKRNSKSKYFINNKTKPVSGWFDKSETATIDDSDESE